MNLDHDLEPLLIRAQHNDPDAIRSLLSVHRERLRKMVAVRIHKRVATRVDPSDVIQDAMLEAGNKLPDYLEQRPMPFYLWLRRFVWQKLIQLHRRHLDAERRTVYRESPQELPLPEESGVLLVDKLMATDTSPSNKCGKMELQDMVRDALARLSNHDREILVLLYLEQLTMPEVSEVLGISQRAANMRHLRALRRVRAALPDLFRM